MSTLLGAAKRLEAIRQKLTTADVAPGAKEALEAMKSRVFERGERTDGKPIGQYSAFTKAKKRQKGKPVDRVRLVDSGKLARSFKVEGRGLRAKITARGALDKLQKQYGRVFKLSKSEIRIFSKNIANQIFKNK